jgi:STE20-related kinase adapter protein alpha
VLISVDGQVCMSGLRSIISLIRHGQRARVVHDFPQYSIKVLPWLSPEVLQQVTPYHSWLTYNTLLLNYNTLICLSVNPGVCQNLQGYDFRSDIYSLGITACELANGHVPFKDMPATQVTCGQINPSPDLYSERYIFCSSIDLSLHSSSSPLSSSWSSVFRCCWRS